MNRTLTAAALAALLAALQGCASPGAAIDKDAQARAAAEKPSPPKAEEFPAPGNAKWKQGAFPGTEKFQRVRAGMGKDQLRELLGWPHFSEGLWGVREWNYLFHFYTGKGSDYVTCQYMVRFNGDELMTGGWWKNPDCALLAQPPAATPIPASTKLAPPQKVTLNADGLFRFDGASLSDLLPAGRARLEHLARELRSNFRSLHYIVVTGHTDRLGSDAYNEALSLERANTVRELLVQQGLDRKQIRTVGMGKRQPVVSDCEGSQRSPALLQCLQPNRRVELDVAGEQ
ncbi:OmpA family protein [Acidovorax cavernicola]|uniref:Outer membrane protein assembly factor BamE n=1 Tax=Acidovorax cavernicola TaxID=1675792 RepID=A0A9X8GTR8_9BURK|nr:OmpA family protein [Acidovorax cavernicola]RIX76806.1 outer membrane protein assembly factor BamE [Acidovorax cavernicola]